MPDYVGARPLNSALEIDLDFERAVRPPPQPTEEATASLEDLIRSRIAERDFDDVPRVAPPAPEVRRKTVDLDDKQSSKVSIWPTLSMQACNSPIHFFLSMRQGRLAFHG